MSIHPPGVEVHTLMSAKLVVSNNKLPQIPECSQLVVPSFTAPFSLVSASTMVVSASNKIPIYISLELTEKFVTPIQGTIFATEKLVIRKV